MLKTGRFFFCHAETPLELSVSAVLTGSAFAHGQLHFLSCSLKTMSIGVELDCLVTPAQCGKIWRKVWQNTGAFSGNYCFCRTIIQRHQYLGVSRRIWETWQVWKHVSNIGQCGRSHTIWEWAEPLRPTSIQHGTGLNTSTAMLASVLEHNSHGGGLYNTSGSLAHPALPADHGSHIQKPIGEFQANKSFSYPGTFDTNAIWTISNAVAAAISTEPRASHQGSEQLREQTSRTKNMQLFSWKHESNRNVQNANLVHNECLHSLWSCMKLRWGDYGEIVHCATHRSHAVTKYAYTK